MNEERSSSYHRSRNTAREKASYDRQKQARPEGKLETSRRTPLFAPIKVTAGDSLTEKLNNTFGEFNEAVSTMRQQKAHTLIGAEALPQTPVDPPLTNSFDFKVASVAGRAKDNETSKLKEEDPLAVNGVKDMANRNKDKESKETTKIGKRRPPKITLPSRVLVDACTNKEKVDNNLDREKTEVSKSVPTNRDTLSEEVLKQRPTVDKLTCSNSDKMADQVESGKTEKSFKVNLMLNSKLINPPSPLTAIPTPVRQGTLGNRFDFTPGNSKVRVTGEFDDKQSTRLLTSSCLTASTLSDEDSEDDMNPKVSVCSEVVSHNNTNCETDVQSQLSDIDSSSSSSNSDSSSDSESSSSDSDSEDEAESLSPISTAVVQPCSPKSFTNEQHVEQSQATMAASRCEQTVGIQNVEIDVVKSVDPTPCGEQHIGAASRGETGEEDCLQDGNQSQLSAETEMKELLPLESAVSQFHNVDQVKHEHTDGSFMEAEETVTVTDCNTVQTQCLEEMQTDAQTDTLTQIADNERKVDQETVIHNLSCSPIAESSDSESDSSGDGLVIDMNGEHFSNPKLRTPNRKPSLLPSKLMVNIPVSRLHRVPNKLHMKDRLKKRSKLINNMKGNDSKRVKFGSSVDDQISEVSSTTNTSLVVEAETNCEKRDESEEIKKRHRYDRRIPKSKDSVRRDEESRKLPSHDYYFQEARKLKHRGDAERETSSKAKLYIQSGIQFISCSYAMESSPNHSRKAVHKMYEDTISLIRYVLGISEERESRRDMTKGDRRLTVICFRCLSLLYYHLFKMKRSTAMHQHEILQEHFSEKAKQTSQLQTSPLAPYDISASRSPAPSPASVGSTGSAGSGTEQHPSSGHSLQQAGRSESMTVAVPHNMVLMTHQHLRTMSYILKSHDLWRQSEDLELKYCKNFFSDISNKLSYLSSMPALVDWMNSAIKWLSES
ncbi:AF4/FMR2 family member 3-like isoform X2 [Corticium candelabrum]|uniref:AF4/FMR2 family member 3-like isoform X2 n=1 Tax=Corticium candelabrum TaxID=121492 RepID=UPI002E2706C8|nr:AF4/FMR2 family member 3-like isoform X2 [Corticium candelabrum]